MPKHTARTGNVNLFSTHGALALQDTLDYYRCFWYFDKNRGSYDTCPYFSDRQYAKVHVYSLSLIMFMWSQPHYRADSFQVDMINNLKNVAVPGTGVPLSWFCYSKLTGIITAPCVLTLPLVYFFLLVLYPLIALAAAFHAWRTTSADFWQTYTTHLLEPTDWFTFWRLNCRLASFHSLLLGPAAPGYAMENKWTFLKHGKSKGVAVSPWLDIPKIVIKDKNVEGGMGIYIFTNTTHGGNFIIQEAFQNSEEISKLLPTNAPLSTLRIITGSVLGLPSVQLQKLKNANSSGSEESPRQKPTEGISSLSCVFRAGRAGADTDHSSILFDVDLATGEILKGTTNAHWYQLGLSKALKTRWLSSHDTTHHPDCDEVKVTGEKFSEIDEIRRIVEVAHKELCPDVPLAGWDIALTTKGIFLLEVNLSCNFFRGTFDKENYVQFVNKYFSELDGLMNGEYFQQRVADWNGTPKSTVKKCN